MTGTARSKRTDIATQEHPSWLRRQLRITWHLPIVLVCLAFVLVIVARWSWLSSSRPRVLHLAGSHAEMGLAHGRALRQEIHELFEAYIVGGLVAHEGWSVADLVAAARHYEPLIPAPYREEMQGIARGSGLPYEHVLVMNTFPDAVLGARIGACSAFAVRTEDGIMVGRNLDWTNFGVAHRYAMVFILAPSSGKRVHSVGAELTSHFSRPSAPHLWSALNHEILDVASATPAVSLNRANQICSSAGREFCEVISAQTLSIGWPGMVGVITGMNDQGLTASLNMAFASDPVPETTPFLLRLRQILEQESTVEGASAALIAEPRSFAANVLLASARQDTAVVAELSGRRHALVPMQNGLLVSTNYFQKLDIPGGVGSDRSAMLEDQLARTGLQTTPRQAQRALARVCFRGSSLGMVTNQSVVLQPAELSAWVAVGKLPASSGRFFEIRMP